MTIILKPENVAQLVFFIRGEKVMLDADLAMLYGVEARSLNQAVAAIASGFSRISCFNSPRRNTRTSGHNL